jgi:hypothetical protein
MDSRARRTDFLRMTMVMRYAHLAPGFLSDEVKKLDTFCLTDQSVKRARKGQRAADRVRTRAKGTRIPKENGSSGWTRTSNPPVNSRMLCH